MPSHITSYVTDKDNFKDITFRMVDLDDSYTYFTRKINQLRENGSSVSRVHPSEKQRQELLPLFDLTNLIYFKLHKSRSNILIASQFIFSLSSFESWLVGI